MCGLRRVRPADVAVTAQTLAWGPRARSIWPGGPRPTRRRGKAPPSAPGSAPGRRPSAAGAASADAKAPGGRDGYRAGGSDFVTGDEGFCARPGGMRAGALRGTAGGQGDWPMWGKGDDPPVAGERPGGWPRRTGAGEVSQGTSRGPGGVAPYGRGPGGMAPLRGRRRFSPARYGGTGREAGGGCYACLSRSVSSAATSTKSLSSPSGTIA